MSDLQFDTVEDDGAPKPAGLPPCAACGSPLVDSYFEVVGRGALLCPGCTRVTQEALAQGESVGQLVGSLALGAGAALAGSLLWWGVAAITGYEIALVAIAIGWMVGRAVRGRSRGGLGRQVAAALLTYAGIVGGYVPLIASTLAAEPDPVPWPVAIVVSIPMAVVAPFAVLFMAGVGGVIGLFIIGFGMFEAWRHNARVEVTFAGPYRVPAPVEAAG